MISDRTLRQWFRGEISDASTLDTDLFAWENRNFDSSNLDLFFDEQMTITAESPSTNEESEKFGIMTYNVIVNKGAGTEDQEDNAETLGDIFDPETQYEIQIAPKLKINIDSVSSGTRSDYDESRVLLPVRMEFRAYETIA